MSKIRTLAFISNVQQSGTRGGAEVFNERLIECLKKYVPYVEEIPLVCNESTFEDILKSYLTAYDFDLSRFDAVLSSKAPTYAVRHPNHICYLMHTMRVFYDMFDEINQDTSNYEKQKLILRLDTEMLSSPHVKKVFSIGQEVTNRLMKYNGQPSTVLHPGMTSEGFFCGGYDYIYMPGRLHKWKRVDLMVKAMRFVKAPVKLKIAGTGDHLGELRALAGGDSRIEFLGFVSDQQMRELYANALVIVFTPIREDYGYILHEGFKSYKPVITCTDSGEPAQFVKSGENGFTVPPDPHEIAQKIDYLFENKEKAKEMGQNGYHTIEHITWDHVVQTLLQTLEA